MVENFSLWEAGKFHPQNALVLAYASQLAYPDGLDTSSDYSSDHQMLLDIERKRQLTSKWGFKSFKYCYSKEKKILAMIMSNNTDIIIAFRGTVSNNFSNWLTDIHLLPVTHHSFGKVHGGFLEAIDAIWVQIRRQIPYNEKRNLRLTGHSLGGALAILAATRFIEEYPKELVKELYTFGQPRVGDKVFQSRLSKSYLNGKIYKIVNYNDMTTVVPPFMKKIMEYVDVGHIGYFNKKGELEFKNHLIEFQVAMNFLTGYFHKQNLIVPENISQQKIKNWRSFSRIFKRHLRYLEATHFKEKQNEWDWENFKHFFLRELPKTPRKKRPLKIMNKLMELFVHLFIKINPYGVYTHSISTYIDLLKKNRTFNYLN